MEKLKKIASDVCIAAISIVIAGLIGVFSYSGWSFMYSHKVFILYFVFSALVYRWYFHEHFWFI